MTPNMNNRFIILVGSYNNAKWAESNIDSILIQDYSNYKVIYFNDASTDETSDIITKKVNDLDRFTIVAMKSRKYKTWFFSNIEKFTEINDNDILVFLDGDDLFYCENVLSYINEIYKSTNCWMTYGGMAVWEDVNKIIDPYPQNSELPAIITKNKSYRKDIWRTSHLKTMRGFLWNRIDKSDLMPDGKAMIGPDDLAIMFAALEMCPADKIYRVTEPVYLYNHTSQNQGSRAFDDNKKLGIDYESIIRQRTPYDTLPIVCPTLAGGLGNQMFEVAMAASLAKDNNAILVINPNEHILPNQGRNINNYTSNIFGHIVLDTNPTLQAQITVKECFYKPIAFRPNVKLQGHFQSFKYFDHNKDYIQKLFLPPQQHTSDLTAVQVRRGDYINFPDHHPMLPTEYYHKAVKMAGGRNIAIFSDDIQWCKDNLHFEDIDNIQYMGKEEDWIELYKMSECKNIIISNSTFGWWAAYLKTSPGKIFAPAQWFGKVYIQQGFKIEDLLPPEWIQININ